MLSPGPEDKKNLTDPVNPWWERRGEWAGQCAYGR